MKKFSFDFGRVGIKFNVRKTPSNRGGGGMSGLGEREREEH